MLLWDKTTDLPVYNDDTLFLHNDDAVSAHNDDMPPVDDRTTEAQFKLFLRYFIGGLFVFALIVIMLTIASGDYYIGCPLAACPFCGAIIISLDYYCGFGRFYADSLLWGSGRAEEEEEEEEEKEQDPIDNKNKEAELKLFIRYYIGFCFVLILVLVIIAVCIGSYPCGALAAYPCFGAIGGFGRFYAGSMCFDSARSLELDTEREEEEKGTERVDDRGDSCC